MRRLMHAALGVVALAALAAGTAPAANASPPTAAPAAVAAPAPAASVAAQGREDCPDGFYCLYDHRGFNIRHADGQIWILRRSVEDLGSVGAADRASSVVNNMDRSIYLYRHWAHHNDPGTCLEVRPHSAYYDLGLYTLDNQVTSVSTGEYPCY